MQENVNLQGKIKESCFIKDSKHATIKQPVPIANGNQIHRVKQKPKLLKVNSEEKFIRFLVCLIAYLVVGFTKKALQTFTH